MITPEQHREIEARLERNRKPHLDDGYGGTLARKAQEGREREQKDCDHKFVDSAHCLKCGWVPEKSWQTVGVEDEVRDLHEPIILHCRKNGWIYLYSNPRRKTGRTLGEVDFQIWMEQGRKVCFECKARGQELSPAQVFFHRAAFRLGHIVHVVYTMDEFYELVK